MFSLRVSRVVLLVVLVAMTACAGDAFAQKRRSRNRNRGNSQAQRQAVQQSLAQAKAQAAVAQQALAIASKQVGAAGSAVSAAEGRMTSAGAAFQSAEDDLRNAEREVRELEQQIVDSQANDSPFAEARDAMERAKKAYDDQRGKVERAINYKARYEAALASSNKAELLPKLQQELLNHSDLLRASITFEAARQACEREKAALLAADPSWKAATDATRAAQSTSSKATIELNNSRLKLAGAKDDYRLAAKAAVAAQAALAQAQAAIGQLEQQQKRLAGSSKGGNSNNRKK